MELLGFEIKRKKKLRPAKPRRYVEPFYMPRDERLHQFSNSEILDALRMISDRLTAVRFTAKVRLIFTDQLIEFIQSHTLELLRRLFYEGYVIIETGAPAPPPDNEGMPANIPPVRFVTGHEGQSPMRVSDTFTVDLPEGQTLMLSTCMQSTGHPDAYFLRDKLEFLDTINASDLNLIKNYGALGIISPEADSSVAGNFFDDEDIKTMQENYRRMYSPSRWSMFFAPRPTRFSAITLPIDALKLSEKRLYCLQAIYTALGIPKELSTYFENAKYENRNAAELDFYNSARSRLLRTVFMNSRTDFFVFKKFPMRIWTVRPLRLSSTSFTLSCNSCSAARRFSSSSSSVSCNASICSLMAAISASFSAITSCASCNASSLK